MNHKWTSVFFISASCLLSANSLATTDCSDDLQSLRDHVRSIHSELSSEELSRIKDTMERARDLYQAGDQSGCEDSIAELKKEFLSDNASPGPGSDK